VSTGGSSAPPSSRSRAPCIAPTTWRCGRATPATSSVVTQQITTEAEADAPPWRQAISRGAHRIAAEGPADGRPLTDLSDPR